MKISKKAAAFFLSAVLTAGVVVTGNGKITAQADEENKEQAGQFKLPDIKMKEGQSGNMTLPEYEKGISFVYTSANTKAVAVNGQGDVEPGSQIITGEAIVTVEVMYNYKIVNTKDYHLKSAKEGDRCYVTDMEGNEVTSVAESGIRYELAMADATIATAELNGKDAKITAVKAGETTMTLTGYVGTLVFGSGSCEVTILSDGNANPQASAIPPVSSEEPSNPPTDSQEPVPPADSETPVASPEASQEPAQSTEPAPQLEQGDADGNGKIELADAQNVLKAALKITNMDDEAIIKAVDIDGNGKIELADAQYILKKALKIIK